MKCPICGKDVELKNRKIHVDEQGNPVFHQFAICKDCKKQWDLDKQRAKKAAKDNAEKKVAVQKPENEKVAPVKKVKKNTETPVKKVPAKTEAPVKKTPVKTDADVKKVPVKKAPVKADADVKQTPVKKASVKADADVKQTPAKKAPVKKAPVKTEADVKQAPVKKAPAKKAPVKTEADAKQTPVKKAPTKKAPVKTEADAKQAPVKKAPVKKVATDKAEPKKTSSSKKRVASTDSAPKKVESVSGTTKKVDKKVIALDEERYLGNVPPEKIRSKRERVVKQGYEEMLAADPKRKKAKKNATPAVPEKRTVSEPDVMDDDFKPIARFRVLRIIFGILSILIAALYAYNSLSAGLLESAEGMTFLILAGCMALAGLLLIILNGTNNILAFLLPMILYLGSGVYAFLNRSDETFLLYGAIIGAAFSVLFIILAISSRGDEEDYDNFDDDDDWDDDDWDDDDDN